MLSFVLTLLATVPVTTQESQSLAAPLVLHDPSINLWTSPAGPTGGPTAGADGTPVPMCVLVRVDGDKIVRLLGAEPAEVPSPGEIVTKTDFTTTSFSTLYEGVELTLAFITPRLPEDLEVFARPVTYVELRARSLDGNEHGIDLYFDVSARAAVGDPVQSVQGELLDIEGLETATVAGTAAESGSPLAVFVSARKGPGVRANYGPAAELRQAFIERRTARIPQEFSGARAADAESPAISVRLEGRSGASYVIAKGAAEPVMARALLASTEEGTIRYFDERMRPYWRRDGIEVGEMLQGADAAAPQWIERCESFDRELGQDLLALGGASWLRLCQHAYRQAFAGAVLCADSSGRPLLFCIDGTNERRVASVERSAALEPLLLLLSSDLTKALLTPLLDYAASQRWAASHAPMELGIYPHAAGSSVQVSAALPARALDSTATLLLMVAALCEREGRVEFAAKYWKQLSGWARLLEQQGFDFGGDAKMDSPTRLVAHDAGLGAKVVLALGAYSRMVRRMGSAQRADELDLLSRTWAAEWEHRATEAAHTKLAFDAPGTWSQKPELAWDGLLKLGLFPEELKQREVAHYRSKLGTLGLPLDSRSSVTRPERSMGSACLAANRADFEAMVTPILTALDATGSHGPIAEEWDALGSTPQVGAAGASVGGFFLRALFEDALARKWLARGARGPLNWARPPGEIARVLVADARSGEHEWRWIAEEPQSDWQSAEFDDASWNHGRAAFGTLAASASASRTEWSGSPLWLRRSFDLTATPNEELRFLVSHSSACELWINGVVAARLSGSSGGYVLERVSTEATAALRVGQNVLAVACASPSGRPYFDVGLVTTPRAGQR
jgi:hypothetical protein